MRRYGITLAQRDEMVKAQNGLCAICEGSMEGKRNMHVDHCHTTKKVRGMLCLECNIGLGKFKDDPELMLKAIAYLRN